MLVAPTAHLNFWEAESPGDKLPIPNSKLQRSTKLQAQKPTCAPFARHLFLGFGVLRFGTSLELGVWCFARLCLKNSDAPVKSCAAGNPAPRWLPGSPSLSCFSLCRGQVRSPDAQPTSQSPGHGP